MLLQIAAFLFFLIKIIQLLLKSIQEIVSWLLQPRVSAFYCAEYLISFFFKLSYIFEEINYQNICKPINSSLPIPNLLKWQENVKIRIKSVTIVENRKNTIIRSDENLEDECIWNIMESKTQQCWRTREKYRIKR